MTDFPRLVRLESADDPRVADYARLTDVTLRRRLEPERGLYIAESSKVLRRALAAGHRPRSFFMAEKWLEDLADVLAAHPDVPLYVGSDEVLEQITGFHLHRGAIAAMQRPEPLDLERLLASSSRAATLEDVVDHTNVSGRKVPQDPGPTDLRGQSTDAPSVRCSPVSGWSTAEPVPTARSRIAVFENLVDHTNLGAAFRSAAALGVDAVLVTPGCADPLYRRSIRVSMGTVFQVPWTRIDPWPAGIDLLKERGYVVAGMTLGEGAITLDELVAEDHENLALVFGTEGHGLTAAADRRLDRRVTIPMMQGVDSLNVAASCAVAFYATR